MSYIDRDYYRNTYKGSVDTTDAELDRLIERGAEWIDDMTLNRIVSLENGFNDLSTFRQDMVQKANAAYVEYALVNGELEVQTSISTDQLSLGSFSMGGTSGADEVSQNQTSYRAYRFLVRSGLAYNGIG